jgi:hypothetical protein
LSDDFGTPTSPLLKRIKMSALTFTRASHEPSEHGQPCHVIDVAKVAVVAGGVCPRHDNRPYNPADDIHCTVIDTGNPDGCWHVQESVAEVLAVIEAEKARVPLAHAIRALDHRVASLEEDRNRRDELDAATAVALQRMRD